MAKLKTMYLYPDSYYDGIMVKDLSDNDKEFLIEKYRLRGWKCIIVGYNDGTNHE